MMKKFKNTSSGFTLIEMLVSLALFAVVSTMSVGTLLVLMEVNGRAQAMQLIMTNLTFSLDAMTREIRTGYNWYCENNTRLNPVTRTGDLTQDCLSGGNLIAVVETRNVTTGGSSIDEKRIFYWFDPDYYTPITGISNHGAIIRRTGRSLLSKNPVTGQDVIIDEFKITARGTTPLSGSDTRQPTATIYIKGRSGAIANGVADNTKEFELQTTIVQRLLDI